MTQNERLRALLAEARDWMIDDTCRDCERGGCELRKRINAALAEPDDVHPSNLTDVVTLLEDDRDEARAEVEMLRAEIEHWKVSAKQYAENYVAAIEACIRAESERDEARAEVERLKALGALQSADIQRLANRVAQGEADWAALRAEAATAHRRGAEAMREAAAQIVIRELDSWMHSSLTDEIRTLPIPEDKP